MSKILSQMKPNFKKIIALILAFCLVVLTGFQIFNFVLAATQPNSTILFASDYQSSGGTNPKNNLTNIVNQIDSAGKNIETTVFCGDYTNSSGYYSDDATASINEINTIYKQTFGEDVNNLHLQGNHDGFNSSTMAASGPHEFDNYIIYVLNTEDSFPWRQGAAGSKNIVKASAENLEIYFEQLSASADTRPVFIAAHVPLHMSSRTSSLYGNNGDNMYASYMFDVINEAGKNRDIVYLFGHNHSHGWDSYLGGGVVYKPIGSTLYVPESEGVSTAYTDKYTAETLNFTYMNAGYVGYNTGSTADATLTASVFDIYDDKIVINRYSANGLYNVGAVGSYNTSSDGGAYNDANGFPKGTGIAYTPVSSESPSPQEVTRVLTTESGTVLRIFGAKTTAAVGTVGELSAVLTKGTPTEYEWSSSDSSIAKVTGSGDVAKIEYNKTGTATISCVVTYKDSENNTKEIEKSFNVLVTETVLGSNANAEYQRVSSITAGDEYLIIYSNGNVMEPNIITSSSRTGFKTNVAISGAGNATITGDYSAYHWSFEQNSSSWYLKKPGDSAQYVQFTNNTNYPPTFVNSASNATSITATKNGNYFRFSYYNSGNRNVQCSESRGVVYGYNGGSTLDFYVYKKTSSDSFDPQIKILNSSNEELQGTYNKDDLLPLKLSIQNISEIVSYNWVSSNSNVVSFKNNDSAAVTAEFKSSGTATIGCTVTYIKDGVTNTVSYTSPQITVQHIKKYEKISSLESLVSGEKYLLIGGNIGSTGNIITKTTSTSGRYSGFASTATSSSLTETINGDYAEYEWIYTNDGTSSYLGNGANNGYINLASRSATLSSSFPLNITVSNGKFTIAAKNSNYKLYYYNNSIFSGYSSATTVNIYKEVIEEVSAEIYRDTQQITNLTQRRYNIKSGSSEQITLKTTGIKNATYSWKSSHPEIATISSLGLITFNGNIGYTYIEATVSGNNSKGEPVTLTRGVAYYASTKSKTDVENPQYPEEGAVRVDKFAESVSFANTGVARVELNIDGIDSNNGIDIVIVADMSSSMDDTIDGVTRVQVMHDSLLHLVDDLMGPNDDGTPSENRVALLGFNNYDYHNISRNNNVSYTSSSENQEGFNYSASGNNPILTGDGTAQGAFQASDNLSNVKSVIRRYCTVENCKSGTNYDLGLMTAYRVLAAAKETPDYDRPQIVIFMSDGTPYQYNYFRGSSGSGGTGAGTKWIEWLEGNENNTTISNILSTSAYAEYFETDGKNRWAEAIKSTTDENLVIDPYNGSSAQKYMMNVKGLGAEIYSLGFCLATDAEVPESVSRETLQRVASTPETPEQAYTYFANTVSDLNEAFGSIRSSITHAATDTVVTDIVGKDYSIQYADSVTVGNHTFDLTGAAYIGKKPHIQIGTYELNGFHKRIENSFTALETVTFETDADGNPTAAYSDLISGNILQNGVIKAEHFEFDINTELCTWYVGTISEKYQYALNYFVSLDGVKEGTREAGSYPTNESAIAEYIDYLGNSRTLEFPIPVMPWKAANITYEFYLVNEQGQPINEQGGVIDFGDRLIYNQTTQTVLLNNQNQIEAYALLAAANLPPGYKLYNNETAYLIHIGANSNLSYSFVSDAKPKQTTFVYRPDGAIYTESEFESEGKDYNLLVDGLNDYTNTFVAFAVTEVPSNKEYSLNILKNNSNGEWLSGAGFRLYDDSSGDTLSDVFIDSEKTKPIESLEETELYTDTNGKISFYGLKEGNYYIKEFRTPNGYQILSSPLILSILSDDTATIQTDGGTYPVTIDQNGEITITVTNRQLNTNIPLTGGGVYFYILIGLAFMGTAVVFLIVISNKRGLKNKKC